MVAKPQTYHWHAELSGLQKQGKIRNSGNHERNKGSIVYDGLYKLL